MVPGARPYRGADAGAAVSARADSAVPCLRGGLPWLGHAAAFHRNPVALLTRGLARHGPHFRFRLFGQTVHALLSPAGNEAFFRASDAQLSARAAYRFTVPIFGPGVAYDVSPELMDEQLRMIHPALRDGPMQSHARVMAEEVALFADRLGASGEIDLAAALNELTVFIAGRCLIGPAFRRRISGDFARLYRDLEGGINLVAFMAPATPTPANLRRDRARRQIADLLAELMAERRRPGAPSEDDFLATLLTARYRDGSGLSDDAITGLLLTLLFAGQHTSAVMATWTGLLLMHNSDTLAAVRAEAETVLGGGMEITPTDLKRLVVLDRCLKESERLYPPLVMLMRTALVDLPVAGRVVPAGSLVLVSPAVSHRLSDAFHAPETFDPDRFGPDREEDRRTPFALIGFGGGKHRCVGLAFAQQQIKVIWGLLLQHFEFACAGPLPAPDYATFVVGPRPPCRVLYRRRAAPILAGGAADLTGTEGR